MTTARDLLTAIDPMPAPERQRHIATTARALGGTAELTALLDDLAGRDEFGRRLAVRIAAIAGHQGHVERALDARETSVVWMALTAAVRLRLPADVLVARLPRMAIATRRRLYRLVRGRKATALADALFPVVRQRYGDDEAAALLATCSAPPLAELEHAATNWSAIGRHHPAALLDLVHAQLDNAPTSAWQGIWWRREHAVHAAADHLPERALDLVERVLPHLGAVRLAPALARTGPGRVARILARGKAHSPDSRAFWGRLREVDEADLIAIGCRLDDGRLKRLLHALPPSRRAAIYRGAVGERGGVPFALLDELRAADRAAEARRLLALRRIADVPAQRLAVTARLPWGEASPTLLEATRRATADERAEAYPLYIDAAAASRDPEVFAAMLGTLTRLANEQDPVRVRALTALSKVPAWLFRASEAALLTKLMVDATQARDFSWQSQNAVRELATALIRQGAITRAALLAEAGLDGLEALGENNGWLHLWYLDRALPRGAEHQVFAALRRRITSDARRDQYSMALALADGLGRRAWHLPELQEVLGQARFAAQESVASRAIELWLAQPATRAERVERVLLDDPSSITLHGVRRAVAFQRTDLLDLLIGQRVQGRFYQSDVVFVPSYEGCFHLWMPRQIKAHAAELMAIARSDQHTAHNRANAIAALGRVPGTVSQVRRFLGDPEVLVAETALAALAWTDEPADVLAELLTFADTDRARVAVYAATRCARFTTPDRLGELLAPVLRGKKVTSRKEAVRLLAEHNAPNALREIADIWPETHRDVRRAIVSACRWFLDEETAWDLLSAAAEGEQAVAHEVLNLTHWFVPERHRTRYAGLVRTIAVRTEADIAGPALSTMPQWSRWDSSGTELLADLAADLNNTATWERALGALIAECQEDFTPLRAVVARLLRSLDEHDTEPDRDLPARQRIRKIVQLLGNDRVPAAHREFERVLAGDLATVMPIEAIVLAASAVDWQSAEVPAQLRFVASLATRPTRALRARDEVEFRLDRSLAGLTYPGILAFATGLVDTAPLLALGIATVGGRLEGWPEHWRAILRQVRADADPDVREAALAVVAAAE